VQGGFRLIRRKAVRLTMEMFLIVFAAMTFVVAIISLIVFIVDVITRNKK